MEIVKAPLRQRFLGHSRKGVTVDEVVLHESVGRTSAISYLKRKGYGVHYEISMAGIVTSHCPVGRSVAHAGGGHNRRSIGIEHVSPYYGSHARQGDMVIEASWAHKGRYIVPLRAQCEASWQLTAHLCTLHDIPFHWPGVTGRFAFKWGRVANHEMPGIMAHHRWHHADGLFFEHYSLCRYLGMDPTESHQKTLLLASCGKGHTDLPLDLSIG